MAYPATQQRIIDVLEKRRHDILRSDFCYTCNGTGAVRKPSSEWNDSEHEYNACPRINPPTKICPDCNGTGLI